MFDLVSAGLAGLWGACVLFRCFTAGLALGGEYTAPPSPAQPAPRGLEWRSVRRLPAGRMVAVRVQLILA